MHQESPCTLCRSQCDTDAWEMHQVSPCSVSFPVRHRMHGRCTQMHERCTKSLPALCVIPSATQEMHQVSPCSVSFPVRHRAGRHLVHLPCICVALGTTQSAGRDSWCISHASVSHWE